MLNSIDFSCLGALSIYLAITVFHLALKKVYFEEEQNWF